MSRDPILFVTLGTRDYEPGTIRFITEMPDTLLDKEGQLNQRPKSRNNKEGSMDLLNPEEPTCFHSCDRQSPVRPTNNFSKANRPRCQLTLCRSQHQHTKKGVNRLLRAGFIIALIVVCIGLIGVGAYGGSLPEGQASSTAIPANWVTISYGGLVDKGVITHNFKNVGEVIREIPQYDDGMKGLVEQYLEPYSILCHDVLLSIVGPDTLPLVNILDHYPADSEQPAWVALFREGHYQLFYNAELIRIFITGTEVASALKQHHSVIRLAIQDVIKSAPETIKKIEVYVFNNDYAHTEIALNTVPA
jgi:hypothetical protein